MTAPRHRLQLLGAFSLRGDDAGLAVPTRKCQALLALLALDGRTGRGRLAAWLWPDSGDADARRNLRVELHRLRQAGLDACMHSVDDAIELRDVSCDVLEFRAAQARRDPAAMAQLAQGVLLDGLHLRDAPAFEAWLHHQRERLAQGQRDALSAWAAMREADDDRGAALECWLRLVEMDPLQESHYVQAMRLQAIGGSREHALALFERCRRTLGRELGLRPLPTTLALVERIRRGDLAASPGETLPATARPLVGGLPAPGPIDPVIPASMPLAGRQDALNQGEARLRQTGLLQLTGPGGIGKTRLASELARRFTTAGPMLTTARPGDAALPYFSAVRLLRGLPLQPAQLPPGLRRELARLLPELGDAPPPMTSDADRTRFLAAAAEAVVACWPPEVKAWVLDDWHLADVGSTALLLHSWRSLRDAGRPVVLVVSRRDEETPAALQALLDTAAAGQAPMALAPLEPQAVVGLVRTLSGADGRLFAQRLHGVTGGNPLFLLETLKDLVAQGLLLRDAQGRWATPFDDATVDYGELRVPATVAETVQRRVAVLGEGVRRLLEAASLLREDFSLDDLAGCTALSAFEAVQALEQASEAHLLRPGTTDPQRWRFSHDVLQQALADGLSAHRRRLLHARLADALQHQGAPPAIVAGHLELAGRAAEAVALRLRAGQALQRVFAHREALSELDQALRLGPTVRQEVEIRHARIEAWRLLGDVVPRLAEIEALRGAAQRLGDRDLEADAAIQQALAHGDLGQRALARQAAEAAVRLQPQDPAARLRAWRIAAWAAMAHGDEAGAAAHLDAGLPLAGQIDPASAVSMLSIRCRLASDRGDLSAALADYERGRTHAGFALRPMIQSQLCSDGARVLLGLGRRTEALALQRQALAVAVELAAQPSVLAARFNLVAYLLHDDQAEAAAAEWALLPEDDDGALGGYARAHGRALLAAHRGDWTAALAANQEALRRSDAMQDTLLRRQERVLRSNWLLQQGDASAALDWARQAAAIEPRPGRHLLSGVVAATQAAQRLGTTDAGAALTDLQAALDSPLPEEDFWYAREQAWMAMARCRQQMGDADALAGLADRIRGNARLQGQARALAGAAQGPPPTADSPDS